MHRHKSSRLVGRSCRPLAIAITAATLAACAQTTVTTDRFVSSPSNREASSEPRVRTAFVRHRKAPAKALSSSPSGEHPMATAGASSGLASTYAEGSQTASGENFNANGLTAAHRTLPFGTRVRVTNHSNGRSVVVTINDRGPFVPGRIIDVTPAAAHALGMSGLAPVTIERE
jgi:rare lipoprotein A